MSLRRLALSALCLCDPDQKVQAVQKLGGNKDAHALSTDERVAPDAAATLPGRPLRPHLIAAKQVATRTPFTPEGLAALLHAVCHIEFNAINLALDAVWRFPDMPERFYQDWLLVAY